MPARVSIDSLRRRLRDPDLQVLCGAGISMIPPTAMPSGNQLRDRCVRELLWDHQSGDILDEILTLQSYQSLLPEAVLQDVGLFASEQLDRLMSAILADASPNVVHRAIAERFETIFTTNFDTCFEASGAAHVVHVHGSVDEPSTLQNRIFRLGKSRSEESEAFESWIAGNPLLILGYSLRDDDVIDAIETCPPREILYLSYDGSLPPYLEYTNIRSVVARGTAQELLFAGSDPGPTVRRARTFGRRPSIGARASAMLNVCYLSGQYHRSPEVFERYEPHLSGRSRYQAIGSIADCLRIQRRFEESRGWIDVLLNSRFCRRVDQADIAATAHNLAALCLLDQGSVEFELIANHFLQAMKSLDAVEAHPDDDQKRTGIEIFRARILNNLGLLYSRSGHYEQAESVFMESAAIKKIHHDERGIAQTLTNLAKNYCRKGQIGKAATTLKAVTGLMTKSLDIYICSDAICELAPYALNLKKPILHSQLPLTDHRVAQLSRHTAAPRVAAERLWQQIVRFNVILTELFATF